MIEKLLKAIDILVAISLVSTIFLTTVCGMLVLTVLLCMWDLI